MSREAKASLSGARTASSANWAKRLSDTRMSVSSKGTSFQKERKSPELQLHKNASARKAMHSLLILLDLKQLVQAGLSVKYTIIG